MSNEPTETVTQGPSTSDLKNVEDARGVLFACVDTKFFIEGESETSEYGLRIGMQCGRDGGVDPYGFLRYINENLVPQLEQQNSIEHMVNMTRAWLETEYGTRIYTVDINEVMDHGSCGFAVYQ